MMHRRLGSFFYGEGMHACSFCKHAKTANNFNQVQSVLIKFNQFHWPTALPSAINFWCVHHNIFPGGAGQNHSQFHKFHLCRKSHCVAVIDTGSNIIAMPSEAVRSFSTPGWGKNSPGFFRVWGFCPSFYEIFLRSALGICVLIQVIG